MPAQDNSSSDLTGPLISKDSDNKAGEQTTKSRSGRWYHATFHTTTVVVGAGVLSLPWAFVYLKPLYGILFLFVALAFSMYTAYQLAYMHEWEDGTRAITYIELGQKILGRRRGNWSILPFQYQVLLGSAISYIILCGQSISHIVNVIARDNNSNYTMSVETGIVIFGISQLILAHVKDFHSLWFLSLLGSTFALSYSSIACILSILTIIRNKDNGVDVVYEVTNESNSEYVFNLLNAMGAIVFAFAGHSVLLETQATLKSPPSTVAPMMIAILITYILSQLVYSVIGVLGYTAYGVQVHGNVLVSTMQPSWLVLLANVLVVLHMVGANLLNYMPVFENFERQINIDKAKIGQGSWFLKILIRSLIVGVTILVALYMPFFADFNGFVGAIGCAHVNLIMPPILWLYHHKVGRLEWVFNVGLIIVGTVFGMVALVGAGRNLVVDAINYHS
eukprot:TRINITY_DN1480_c0_g1_i1.p1 TRINITY_DN1480_c0_g1~~TRINITY_DN1480_c0_g1_i1.p1  ORF type:complete len:468 (-),score=20.59 TRINITY_DN1480_c0_g1_i1:1764-3110(-)